MKRVVVCSCGWRLVLMLAMVSGAQKANGVEPQAEVLPPWQRVLLGGDAKRAEELSEQIAGREEADDYAGALEAGNELLDLRKRVQGRDHWEAVNAVWNVEVLRRVGALSAEDRKGGDPHPVRLEAHQAGAG